MDSTLSDVYKLISPEDFTIEHLNYIEEFKKSITLLSSSTGVILGAKDIHSRHIISTNAFAKIVGLKNGNEVTDRFDREMPCEGTAQYADCFVEEDRSLINKLDLNKGMSILNVHSYSDGMKARVFKKYVLAHKLSKSILGTIYSGHDVALKDIFNIIPSYVVRFGATGSIELVNNASSINPMDLTDYEQEICFLILLNWEFKQIADFMNQLRPTAQQRTADTIIKKKNYICQKLNLGSSNVKALQDLLVSIGFHNKMPSSFYNMVAGSKILEEIPVGF